MIKIRAWHKQHQEMVYFDNKKAANDQYQSSAILRLMSGDTTGVLMQFTGLQDSTGKDIYEGDILDFDESEWGGKFDNEVIPDITSLVGEWPLCGSVEDVKQWRKVVGNIYEPQSQDKGEI